jgi:hypothetical protein
MAYHPSSTFFINLLLIYYHEKSQKITISIYIFGKLNLRHLIFHISLEYQSPDNLMSTVHR